MGKLRLREVKGLGHRQEVAEIGIEGKVWDFPKSGALGSSINGRFVGQ